MSTHKIPLSINIKQSPEITQNTIVSAAMELILLGS